MPRYFFDIKNGHRLIDPAGLDCFDESDALTKARAIAAQIAQEVPNVQRKIAVLDADRKEVATVPVFSASTERAAE
jgi:hypothetical protein